MTLQGRRPPNAMGYSLHTRERSINDGCDGSWNRGHQQGPLYEHGRISQQSHVDLGDVLRLRAALKELHMGDGNPEERQARVITSAKRPYQIMHVNRAWENLCGFAAEEAVGQTFGIMQGPATNGNSLYELQHRLSAGRPSAQLLLNYKKNGDTFLNFLQVCPVYDDSGNSVTHFLGQLEDMGKLDARVSRMRLGNLGWDSGAQTAPSMDLQSAMMECRQARVITEARAPHRILHVNKAWQGMCGFSADEAVGSTLRMIQGECTNPRSLALLNAKLVDGVRPANTLLLNYKRSGEPFINYLQVSAVVNQHGCVTHLVGQLEDLTLKDGQALRAPRAVTACRPTSAITDGVSATPSNAASPPAGSACESRVQCSRAEGSASEVLVGLEMSLKVLNISVEFLDLFDLTACECLGRSLGVVSGPETDSGRIMQIVAAAASGYTSESTLMLYSKSGLGNLYHVHGKPFGSPLKPTGCLLAVIPADSLTIETAMMDDGTTKALVDAVTFRAVQVSSAFEETYGLPGSVVIGRTLNVIHGPRTDLSRWRSMLSSSSNGSRVKAKLVTVTSTCVEKLNEIEFRPVLSQHGFVSHVLVTVAGTPSVSAAYSVDGEFAEPCDFSWGMGPALDAGLGSCMTAKEDSALSQPPHDPAITCHAEYQDGLDNDARRVRTTTSPLIADTTYENLLGQEMRASEDHESKRMLREMAHVGAARRSVEARTLSNSANPSFHCSEVAVAAISPDSILGVRGSIVHEGSTANIVEDCMSSSLPGDSTSLNRKAVSKVIPRRKPGQSLEETKAVCISLETLERFSNIPLAKAAVALGISPTAMKKACRRLGITRWPHSTQAAPAKNDGAYVRRIQRKHAASLHKEAGTPQASEASTEVSTGPSDAAKMWPGHAAIDCANVDAFLAADSFLVDG